MGLVGWLPSLHHLGRHISYYMCLYFMMSWSLTSLKLVWLTKTAVNIMKMGLHLSQPGLKNDQLKVNCCKTLLLFYWLILC